MTQHASHWITAKDMVRSRAWRQGYESFRKGEPPAYDGRRSKCLAYEYGRLTAAHLTSQGVQLVRVSPLRPVNEAYVPDLARALLDCVGELQPD